jgi:hypothetical protein
VRFEEILGLRKISHHIEFKEVARLWQQAGSGERACKECYVQSPNVIENK